MHILYKRLVNNNIQLEQLNDVLLFLQIINKRHYIRNLYFFLNLFFKYQACFDIICPTDGKREAF